MTPSRLLTIIFLLALASFTPASAASLQDHINILSRHDQRITGSEGCRQAADYIKQQFRDLGITPESYLFTVPVRNDRGAKLTVAGDTIALDHFQYNAVSPQATDGSLAGPLYYTGSGSWPDIRGMNIENSIIIIDADSGQNWQKMADLGARAIIYLSDSSRPSRYLFQEKMELTPMQLPCFWMEKGSFSDKINRKLSDGPGLIAEMASLSASVVWQQAQGENIYGIIQGSEKNSGKELLIVEAFYDSSAFVAGQSPGADEAASIAALLRIAQELKDHPPDKAVLLLATSGHAQTLAGMRDIYWSIASSKKLLKNRRQFLRDALSIAETNIETLENLSLPLTPNPERDRIIKGALGDYLKLEVDSISRRLIALRLTQDKEKPERNTAENIKKLSRTRMLYRRMGWRSSFHNLAGEEKELFTTAIPAALQNNKKRKRELKKEIQELKNAFAFRDLVEKYEIAASISLHLSSHGDGIGAFHQGFLYDLKARVNRTGIFSVIADLLDQSAMSSTSPTSYRDTLRPSRMRAWESWFLDKPGLGGEIASLAGKIGITMVTTGDGRASWGTPWDTAEHINWESLRDQELLLCDMIKTLAGPDILHSGKLPLNGFATLSGRANLLLQGELFADHPAAGTILLAYQGDKKHYTMVDTMGTFQLKGLADKKHVLDKAIIEGYRFDEESGRTIWAIDKKLTGKDNYRVKIRKNLVKTDLILFPCQETTIFGLIEPRNFNYLTKINLLDGRRDAPPQHYWYSRIDTRKSTAASIYTEPGTWLKVTLSDNVLSKKMILSNGTARNPMGFGYPVAQYHAVHNTIFHAANDIWTLLSPRIRNLEKHGIVDDKISALEKQGLSAMDTARKSLAAYDWATFSRSTSKAMALANRVYSQVEKTQKDILLGVLFYISLFVPFAFCVERFLFNYTNIYKRIIAFTTILLLLIIIISQVHPAFQLAYSPTVIILAFFILGLSLMVSLIIFFRFEEEMILLQRRASHKRPAEISHWKAFTAAFFLGVSNLRRRRIRTVLTCLTLIILTFTIMSFTTVKSGERQSRLLFQETSPYTGLLLKRIDRGSLPVEAVDFLIDYFQETSAVAPRIWMEADDPGKGVHIPVTSDRKRVELQGLIGLSPKEAEVTGFDGLLTSGRWFTDTDRHAIILEKDMAADLGLSDSGRETVTLWGYDFHVIGTFDGQRLDNSPDLDGEPLTPVIFPQEAGVEITEVEQEAMESGDDVRSLQSRYQHIPASSIAIIPASTLLTAGGRLKNMAVLPPPEITLAAMAEKLVDRFSLSIFTGEDDGVWLYNQNDSMKYSGVPNIAIPLLIAVFIVLNTMISTVHERKNEIAIYTSVGLAPSHVSFLFVAEAMALAVISVVIGYLVAQVSAAIFADTSMWAGLTVNYSSMAGIGAMILVMGVVLLSVIYPSKMAARIAIPDVNATFQLPRPRGNKLTVTLPFFMKYSEHDSLGGYIFNYFQSHQDVSHGLFSTGPVELVTSCCNIEEMRTLIKSHEKPHEMHCTYIRAKVWLAPFDFGIMQWVDIQFCPVEGDSEYLEIKATMERRAGEKQLWQRINTSFIHDLRKQLLVWRSIDDENHQYFAAEYGKIVNSPQTQG